MDKKNKHINHQSSHLPSDLQWLKYLNKELSESESHALESEILNDDFESDAMDGLEQLSNPEKIDETLKNIKQNILKKAITHKPKRRRFDFFNEIKWSILALLILILIIICAIVIINLLKN